MKIIAFKRAKNHPHLHPEFIVEFIDASLLESLEGYETMIEEHFQLEFQKNQERHEAHLAHLKEQEQARIQSEKNDQLMEEVEQRELNREFELFKRWRQNKQK